MTRRVLIAATFAVAVVILRRRVHPFPFDDSNKDGK